jgi:hypothetical protein
MQCPQAMHPKTGVLVVRTFFSNISILKSLQTSTHRPQPEHFSLSIIILAGSFVLEVGIAIYSLHYNVYYCKITKYSEKRKLGFSKTATEF